MFDEIINFLRKNKVDCELIEHEPVFTSEEAAKIRGLNASMGAKSLLLKANDEFILCVLPGSKRLDSNKKANEHKES